MARSRKRIASPSRAPSKDESDQRNKAESRILGMRTNRYSWWTHWRECADYILPRRYRWLVTPNLQSRGSPINQHILDSTGTLASRNLASGLMSGVTNPTRIWFRLKIGEVDSTLTSPISIWLSECERLLMRIFHESNFYNSVAVLYYDLVVFGTASMLIYEDYDNVILCFNPCLGEFYLENDQNNSPAVFGREFTYTVSQTVEEFGYENCSQDVRQAWDDGGSALSREIIIAHLIEPNSEPETFGIPEQFKHREVYFQWGGTQSQQNGTSAQGFLRKKGYHEAPHIPVRWDLVSNDAYGRGPGMDSLPDIKQLQLESRRKSQAIDKLVNPPMVADIQLKNQPASLLPGGVTYVAGLMSQSKPGFAPVYQVQPPIGEITEDLNEVRGRIKETFFVPLFQTISQFETRSNVSATEIDARRAESLIMLGPVLERLQTELLSPVIERTFAIAARAGILPPSPPEVQGLHMRIEYSSMLEQAQSAASAAGIERVFAIVGQLAGIDPSAADNVDIDYGIDKISHLLNNDPKLIRSPEQLEQIRQMRAQQQQQQQQAEMAEKLAAGAKTLSEIPVGGTSSALGEMTGLRP